MYDAQPAAADEGEYAIDLVVRSTKNPCDRSLVAIPALLFCRGHHFTRNVGGRGCQTRAPLPGHVPSCIWKRDTRIDDSIRSLHVTSTARGLNQSNHSIRFLPFAKFVGSSDRFRREGSRVPDTIAWLPRPGPGAQLESQRGGIPSHRPSSYRHGCSRTLFQYSPVCLACQGTPQHTFALRVVC